MLRLNSKIYIYDKTGTPVLYFPFVISCEITKDFNEFTDTAKVTLPQRIYELNKRLSDLIKVGYSIDIWLGYFDNEDALQGRKLRFKGYVTKLTPKEVIELECENEAYIWKMKPLAGKMYYDIDLKSFISDIYTGKFECEDLKIGTWAVSENSTLIDILAQLKATFGFRSFWQDGILYVGADLSRRENKTILFDINQNVIENSDNLIYQSIEDFRLVVHGISEKSNNTSIETYCYYNANQEIVFSDKKPLGYINEMKFPNLTKIELQNLAKKRLQNLNYNGVKGDIQTFGEPIFDCGDYAKIVDKKMTERNGIYEITKNSIIFGESEGYKQTATLGMKIV